MPLVKPLRARELGEDILSRIMASTGLASRDVAAGLEVVAVMNSGQGVDEQIFSIEAVVWDYEAGKLRLEIS